MKFRKKPVVVEAVQWNGKNLDEIQKFCGEKKVFLRGYQILTIPTLEGDMNATPGDWIIRGVHGEFYPCKPDIFSETYEPEPIAQDVWLEMYKQRWEYIMGLDIPEDTRAERLAEIMTEMEREYRINVFQFGEWEKKAENREIASLYQKISRSREW